MIADEMLEVRVAPEVNAAYELVVPVELPEGMTPDEFLRYTSVLFRKADAGGYGAMVYRSSINGVLEDVPILGPKEMRRVA